MSRTRSLTQLLEKAGFPHCDVPLLHAADVFLDLSGEDIRSRLFLTQDSEGREMCLRPEFTIPLCKALVSSGAYETASMSYCGPVFRHRAQENAEFIQAGVESLGRVDSEAADADILALAIDAARELGMPQALVRLGDAGLINGVLAALDASPSFARRLKRRLAAGKSLEEAIAQPSAAAGLDRFGGVMAALEGAGPKAASAFVGDMLMMSGLQASGGRSAAEIAERFMSKAQQGSGAMGEKQLEILTRFLSLSGTPDDVADQMQRLAREANLDLSDAINRYEARIGFMAARGIDIGQIAASARFVRNLDYYTGMVFEIVSRDTQASKPLIGGGRYDNLLRRLGAAKDVPAVGFAVWVERFDALAGEALI
ncbi:MAG: ATP phosphoribosyltransferase regulatory subunit [Beijerinckiaceae bacterium]